MLPAIPRSGGLPLLGALPRFLRDPLGTLDRTRTIGDISRLELGLTDAVTLHHPEHFDHVFRSAHRNYAKEGPFWSTTREVLGNGLPVSEGDIWRRHRRMMQPQFHRQRLAGLATLVVDALEDTLEWGDVDDGWKMLDVGSRMPHLTMNVTSASLLGTQTSEHRAQLLVDEIGRIQTYMFRAMVTHRVPRWLPMPGRGRFARSMATVHREMQRIIDSRRRATDQGSDLLGLLINATDDDTGDGMTDAQLLDETLSLFLAGYDTTATSLQWALALLSTHNDVWQRLREECDGVLRGRAPRAEDIRRLPYARWVMQEATRLFPPVWWLPRIAVDDDEIGGHSIAAGTIVAPVMYTVHRHPDLWKDPKRFDPERFEASRSVGRHSLAWCPFGAGPRKCIGQELSLMESTFALAMMTQKYELAATSHMPRPEARSTLRPVDGQVYVRIRRRRAARRTLSVSEFHASESSSAISV